MKIIDLSHPIKNAMPVYPGDRDVEIVREKTWENDGYRLSSLTCSMHIATHIDAPSHLSKDETMILDVHLNRCIGRSVLVDVRNKAQIDISDIEQYPIEKDDIVIFLTGWSQYFGTSAYDDHPTLSESCAKSLVEKEVKLVAVDMPSVDHAPYPVHRLLFEHGILIAENLCNCESLVNRQFQMFAIPISIDAEGALSRVFAIIED